MAILWPEILDKGNKSISITDITELWWRIEIRIAFTPTNVGNRTYKYKIFVILPVIVLICKFRPTMEVNKHGRTYKRGKAISDELRSMLIDEIVENGGDITTGFIPGSLEC